MRNDQMMAQMAGKPGFIAALDQSGGSTPGALKTYGIPETAYSGEAAMYKLVHEMRVRIITAPSFTGDKIIGAILFERTMDGEAESIKVPTYLWEKRGVVPFLKVDQGLAAEAGGVRLMKPIAGLDTLLARAAKLGIFGTKMRSVIDKASPEGIAAIVKQQFDLADQIMAHGLVPILEPEVSVGSPEKDAAEKLLLAELQRGLEKLPPTARVMLKITIPTTPDLYAGIMQDPRMVRVVALSGGYERDDACRKLAQNHGLIASFSRALVENLRYQMSDEEFDAKLAADIAEIYRASTVKV